MNKNQLIYIGSPYSSPDKAVEQLRHDQVLDITADLLNQGYHVISPIVHCHSLSIKHKMRGDFEFWKAYNFALLSKCDVLLIIPLDGWKTSVGLGSEMFFAEEHGIEIEKYNLVTN